MELRGKTALVTGGAIRVGKAIALELAARGGDVGFTYRSSSDDADRTAEEIRALGRRAHSVHCDQRDPESVAAAIRSIEAVLGPVDVLVNSAAIFKKTPFETATPEDWSEHLEVNLRGPALFAQHLGLAMKARGEGVIINMVDIAAERPYLAYLPYSTSKAALVSLTRGLARLLAPEVRVNGVAPGTVLWPDDYPEDQRVALVEKTPLKRAGSPEDIARAVGFLIEDAGFVTGAILPVDGGMALA